jgi:FKBP-type peptidyl-prolyl cis-trans isomerase FklB
MQKLLSTCICLLFFFGSLNSQISDSLSYALGVTYGENMKTKGAENIDGKSIGQGFEDALKGEPKISSEEANKMVRAYINKQQAKVTEMMKAEGEAFLAENKKRAEVITTESGLQYEILTKGTGAIPEKSDKVVAHYEGKLLDGTKFDSSFDRGEPATFPVGGLIPGWVEALQLMPTGSKWRLYIPQDLAYGPRGAGGAIPPYAALIFDLELIEIK